MTPTAAETFAGNRAHGSVDFAVAFRDGRTRPIATREEGSLRVRFPSAAAARAEAVLINTAGGIAGGDRFSCTVRVEPGAALTVGTAAAEKIYRTLGPPATIATTLRAEAEGALAWLPHETILFDGAALDRTISVELWGTANVLALEGIVFGRIARGETLNSGRILDRWRVRQDGRLIFADTLRLDGTIGRTLSHRATADGAGAIGTLLIAPGRDHHATAVRDVGMAYAGEVGASSWNGVCVARFCAHNGADLRNDFTLALRALGAPLPRSWLI